MKDHARTDIVTASSLAALAGFVDAIGYMKIGGYFVAFMSGNTTVAGVSLAEGRIRDFGLAAGLIAFFVVGVIAGTLLGQRVRVSRLTRRRRAAVVLFAVTVLLALAALSFVSPATAFIAPPLMAMAMGMENAVFERDGEVTIGLTYMTGTLVKLGQSVAMLISGKPAPAWRRYLFLWAGLTAGTIVGAIVYSTVGIGALWVAVACSAAAASTMWLSVRK